MFLPLNGWAEKELLGQLKVEDFLLQPVMQTSEKKQGGFELAVSFVKLNWSNEDFFSAHLGVGSKVFRRPSIFSGQVPTSSSEVALTDAYAMGSLEYVWIKVGLQQVGYGYSAMRGESGSLFPQSIATSVGLFPLRDLGFSIGAKHKHYSTQLMAFNGESGENQDQEAWLSGLWTYQDGTSAYGFSGITAEIIPTKPALAVAGLWIPDFVDGERSKLRLLNMFAEIDAQQFKVVLEFHKGDLIQKSKKSLFDAWSVSMDWLITEDWHFGLQVENFDPDQGDTEKSFRKTSVGVIKTSKSSLSSYGIVAIKNTESPNEFLVNDQLMFFIRVAPSVSQP